MAKGGTCRIEGCNKPTCQTSALCAMHRSRQTRHGDPLIPRRRPRVTQLPCTVPDCTKPIAGKGLCATHWQHAKRHGGDPLAPWGKPPFWTDDETRKLLDLIRDDDGRIDPDMACRPGETEALSLHLGRSKAALRSKLVQLRKAMRAGGWPACDGWHRPEAAGGEYRGAGAAVNARRHAP